MSPDSHVAGNRSEPAPEQVLEILAATANEAAGRDLGATCDVLCRSLGRIVPVQGAGLASYVPLTAEIELRTVLGDGGRLLDLSGLGSRRRKVSEAWLADLASGSIERCRHQGNCLFTLFGGDLAKRLPAGGVCHRLSCAPGGRLALVGFVVLAAEAQLWQRQALAAFMGLAGALVQGAEAAGELASSAARVGLAVERRTRQLQGILGAATHAVIMATDPDGTLTLFNAGAEHCLGYRASEVVGRAGWLPFYQEREIAEHADELEREFGEPIQPERVLTERARRGGEDRRVWTLVGRDRRPTVVDQTVTAIRDDQGELTGYLAVGQDIRSQLEVHEQLRSARRAAETANRVKSEFLARTSHELRTPLNGIIGMADMLENTRLDREQHEYVRTLSCSAQSLLDIVGTVLDFSGLEEERLRQEAIEFDLKDLLADLRATYARRASSKGLEYVARIALGTPSKVVGDRHRLGQLLGNLLDNAVKFTEHGQVALTARGVVREGDRATFTFTVDDNGPGIAAERIPALFHAFGRLDELSSSTSGGAGLGLAISQRMAELLGGRITVESELGKGASFVVTLPLEVVPRRAATPHVLVVGCRSDEDSRFQTLLDAGWEVECVPSGALALKVVRETPPAVVVFLLGTPGVDVAGTVRQMRRLERARGIINRGQTVQPTRIVLLGALPRGADPAIWQTHGLGLEKVLSLPLTAGDLGDAAGEDAPAPTWPTMPESDA